jgi:hypothetical protein
VDMATSRKQAAAPADPDCVVAWRILRLRDVGCPVSVAEAVARDRRYGLHVLLELVDRGCPAELAARILAPLQAKDEAR